MARLRGAHRIGYVTPVEELSLQQAQSADIREAGRADRASLDEATYGALLDLLAERRVELAVGPDRKAPFIVTVHLERVNDVGVSSVEAWFDPRARLVHRAGVGIRVPRSLAGALVVAFRRAEDPAC
jgi:hypothetical protein